jgi:hypothetical protein
MVSRRDPRAPHSNQGVANPAPASNAVPNSDDFGKFFRTIASRLLIKNKTTIKTTKVKINKRLDWI